MEVEESTVDYWSLSHSQLVARITAVANGDLPAIDQAARAEASQLAVEWHEAIDLPNNAFEDQEMRVRQLDSLQRRIIEILISASRSSTV